ncbi:hypothetical protein LOK49_LG12G00501 [Camellia lanceoleosa]|uniref:Uncharacterized protein n=1 Tax=Camellia lanceoleosa TaxID=1840588 RepID=A0ACC0FRB8_9ERIC|nr:hypothetical protein LOK49_LG12G00501 [Camellia lanceoleosa]
MVTTTDINFIWYCQNFTGHVSHQLKIFYSGISAKVPEAKDTPHKLQQRCHNNPLDEEMHLAKKEGLANYIDLPTAKEKFKRRRSRVQRLASGDSITKLFHKKVASHMMSKATDW